jgi:hypothetical protein
MCLGCLVLDDQVWLRLVVEHAFGCRRPLVRAQGAYVITTEPPATTLFAMYSPQDST